MINSTSKTVIKRLNESYMKPNTKFLVPMRMITVVQNLRIRLKNKRQIHQYIL